MERCIFASRYPTVEQANAPMPEFDPLNIPYYRRLGPVGDMSIDEILDHALKNFSNELNTRNGTPYLFLCESDGTIVRL